MGLNMKCDINAISTNFDTILLGCDKIKLNTYLQKNASNVLFDDDDVNKNVILLNNACVALLSCIYNQLTTYKTSFFCVAPFFNVRPKYVRKCINKIIYNKHFVDYPRNPSSVYVEYPEDNHPNKPDLYYIKNYTSQYICGNVKFIILELS